MLRLSSIHALRWDCPACSAPTDFALSGQELLLGDGVLPHCGRCGAPMADAALIELMALSVNRLKSALRDAQAANPDLCLVALDEA